MMTDFLAVAIDGEGQRPAIGEIVRRGHRGRTHHSHDESCSKLPAHYSSHPPVR